LKNICDVLSIEAEYLPPEPALHQAACPNRCARAEWSFCGEQAENDELQEANAS
jgi:hypothetical protein